MVLPRTLMYFLYHKLDFWSKTTKARIFQEGLPTAYIFFVNLCVLVASW
jgi:tellurite resistance-related uncharacterized protein